MLFNSPVYVAFLGVTYAAFWLLRSRRPLRVLWLAGASYFFYFYGTLESARRDAEDGHAPPLGMWGWSVLCLLVIFLGSSLDFWIGLRLGRTEDPKQRKRLLWLSVGYYLGILAVFKYFDFALDSFASLLSFAHLHVPRAHLALVLPFGISFFTFETMSYTIDVYRRELEPCRRYGDYLLFVSFFPHLVSGPIVRPSSMLPQLAKTPVFDETRTTRGLLLIAQGIAMKVVIGDGLRESLVDRVFDNPERFSSVEVLAGVYGYAVQIYSDFSGYTNVALGSSLLFGYVLPENFRSPYVSTSLQDFWRRWHMSLSAWLRDYLYIPLGGSKDGRFATYRNLLLTMLLGGLWHGASWCFVAWGGLHGLGLAVERFRAERASEPGSRERARWRNVLAVVLVFHFVCFAWIFFRAGQYDTTGVGGGFAHAWAVLGRLGSFSFGTTNLPAKAVLLMVLALTLHAVPEPAFERMREFFFRRSALVQGTAFACVAVAVSRLAATKVQGFIYGQF